MDGIDYYGFEQVNIGTGSGSEVFNVEGTTKGSNGFAGVVGACQPCAQTNIALDNGDDRVYLSSNANLDQNSWNGFDFLTGNLDDFRGALNIDLGAGRHRLFMSDEAIDPCRHVRDHRLARRHAQHQPGAARDETSGARHLRDARRPARDLVQDVRQPLRRRELLDGSGSDTIYVDGTKPNGAQRTTTILDTGLGDDNVTVNLTAGQRRVLRARDLRRRDDRRRPRPHMLPAGATDNDTVDASVSTLPLIIIGGYGNDTIAAARATTSSSATSGSCSTRPGRAPTRCWRSSASADAAT